MRETSKTHKLRLDRSDFARYIKGNILDIGSGGDPITPPEGNVKPWDWGDGDATYLNGLEDNTFDCVYSSHCLEHLHDPIEGLKNWIRVTKSGGYIYFTIPDFTIYEKEQWPSIFNSDHKSTFSIHKTKEEVGRENHMNIVSDMVPTRKEMNCDLVRVDLEDQGYDYNRPNEDQTRGDTMAQICTIWRKL